MKKNSFVEGAVIATAAVIITKILGMLYVIPFYKIIGTQGGALYSYAYNIYTIFIGISGAGIPGAISKIVGEYHTLGHEEAKYRTYRIGIKIIGYMSIIAFLIMFIFADLFAISIIGNMKGGNTPQDVAFVIRCISFAVLVIPYLSVTRGFIQGHKIIAPSSISNILEQVVRIFVILTGSFLAYKVFSSSLTLAVGIAVSGAFFGALVAYLYLRRKMKENKEALGIKKYEKRDAITNKDIMKKILSYSIPFIIISVGANIYNFTDMIMILRGLNIVGFSTTDTEFIQSAMTTWSSKICTIVTSLSLGMVVSLIPNMVASFVKQDWQDLNNKMNKAYQIILVVSIPCAIGICILSKPIWSIFYGNSTYGPQVLAVMAFSALFSNLYAITFNTMQSMNKYRFVYLALGIGFLANALLDIPLIILFKFIGLPPFWGATFGTIISYIISIKMATHHLKKNYGMKYWSSYRMTARILVPSAVMTLALAIFNYFIRFDYTTTIGSLSMIIVNTVLGALIYISIGFKMHVFQDIFGTEYLNKIIKKLTFGRVSLKN